METSSWDTSSQTTHHFLVSPQTVTVTRPHHPLLGQQLGVWQAAKNTLIVTLPDGSRMRLPRAWTDADTTAARSQLERNTRFTVGALRELLDLVERLRARV